MDSLQFFDVIIFAMVAVFLVLRLRSVLGRRTGHEKPPPMRRVENAESADAVVRLPDRAVPEAADDSGDDTVPGLIQIKIADPGFDADRFIAGARAAFEMIVTAYAAGDRESLRPLLSDEVFARFDAAIGDREGRAEEAQTTLAGISEAEIIDASMDGRDALVTVRFVSDQINPIRDSDSEPSAGRSTELAPVTDIWTFSRDTGSRDPNWTLVTTGAPA